MATPSIRLSASQVDDLASACARGSDGLDRVAKALASEARLTITPTRLRESLIEVVGAGPDDALFRALFGLAGIARARNLKGEEVVASVERGLRRTDWNEEQWTKWKECRESLATLLDLPSVKYTSKALDLSFDYVFYCINSRVLTDMRPVFDETREDIVGAVVAHTLRLDYAAHEGRKSLSIAMDADDLRILQQACESALRKADALEAMMQQKLGIETFVAGSEGYAGS